MTMAFFCSAARTLFRLAARAGLPVLALVLLLAPPAAAQDGAAKPILTLTGLVERTTAFTLADLDALPQVQIRTSTPWHEGVKLFSGPSLDGVLRKVGAKGTTLSITALNDYAAQMPASDAAERGPILATRIDGQPMSVRAKGPIFVIYPFDANPDLRVEMIYNRSVWQVKQIDVR